jgi:hypothetical protein
MEYTPYTPDRAPSDYNSFPAIKQILGGYKFKDDRKVKVGTRRLVTQDTYFY